MVDVDGCLFWRQPEAPGAGIARHVAAGCHGCQPFGQVALVIPGRAGQVGDTAAQPGAAKRGVRVDGAGFKVDRKYDLPVRAGWPSVLRSQIRVLDRLAAVELGSALDDGLMHVSVNGRMLVRPLPPIRVASDGWSQSSWVRARNI